MLMTMRPSTSPQTSFLNVCLVVRGPKPGPFVRQQGHQRLGHHEVGRRDQLVLFCHAPQEARQELPLNGVVNGGQVHARGS